MTMEDSNPVTVEQFLIFELADELYAIEIIKVQEIRGWGEPVREIPDTPAFVKGTLNLRGAIVPIIDLSQRFKLAPQSYTATTVIIIVTLETGNVFGVVADVVSDVIDIKTEEIKAVDGFGAKIDTRYMRGMYVSEEKMILLLDIDKLLAPDELIRLCQ